MLTIFNNRYRLFQKKEIWFYNGESIKEADYTNYCYVIGSINFSYDKILKEETSVIDLSQTENELFLAINNTFRYHIKKAESLNFIFTPIINPSIEDCKILFKMFEKFAFEKKITPMNQRRIFALQQTKNLIITKIKHEDIDVVIHVYLFDVQRILLMHTFHNIDFLNKKISGYANKYLHWKDILFFKEMNFKLYDFGGINQDKVPGISRFKLSFGGRIIEVNSYTRITPWLKLIFKLVAFKKKK